MGAVLDIARTYGEFTRDVTEKQNAELVKTAQMNYDVAEQQINAAKQEQAQQLALQYQQAQGAALAMAAYRGIGENTDAARAEGMQAERARRNLEINAANQIAAAAAGAQVQQSDPNLAQWQGTMMGLELGGQLAQAQAAMPYETVYHQQLVQTGAGYQTIWVADQVQETIDLGELLEGLNLGGLL